MFKKILIFTLCICLLIPAASFGAAGNEDTFNTALYGEEISFFDRCGIIDNEFYSADAPLYVTRGEFAKLSLEIMGVKNINSDAPDAFLDVPSDSKYLPYINMASVLGLFSGTGDGNFNPDSFVDINQVLKVILTVMGYKDYAQSKGGYPTGYILAANEADIAEGVSLNSTSPAFRGDVLRLTYNALFADLMVADGFNEQNSSYKVSETDNILNTYHDIYSGEGIVKSDWKTSSYKDTQTIGKVIIDTNVFKAEGEFALGYVGKNIEYFYKDKNELVFVREKENKEVLLDAGDISSYDGTNRVYRVNDDKNTGLNLETDFCIIYNGFGLDGSELVDYNTILNPGTGYVRLIDNNQNNRYDYVIVEKSDIVLFSSYDELKDIIYDKQNRAYDISLNSYSSCNILNAASLNEIKKDSILMVYKSVDNKHITIEVCTKKLSAKADEIYTDGTIIIGGEQYKIAPNARFTGSLNLGQMYVLYLDNAGNIVYREASDSKSYGYIMRIGNSGSGINTNVTVQMISQSGKIEEYHLADKVTVEDISSKTSYAASNVASVLNTAMASLYPSDPYNGIKIYASYKLYENKINYIGLPYVIESESDFENYPEYYDFFRLDYLVDYAKTVEPSMGFTPKNHTIGLSLALKQDCPVFFVPELNTSMSGFNMENAGVRLSSDCPSGMTFNLDEIEAYSTDTELRIIDSVIRQGSEGLSGNISHGYNNSCLVTEIKTALGNDGETLWAIDIIENGKSKTIYADEASVMAASNMKPSFSGNSSTMPPHKTMLKAGDVIKYSLDQSGKIAKIALMYDMESHDICYKGSGVIIYDAQYRYTSGEVVDLTNGYGVLKLHSNDSSTYKNEMHLLSLFERIYVYNYDTDKAYIGGTEDISIGDKVYVVCNWRVPKEIIVYKGGIR